MALILDGTDGITQPTITTAFGLPAGTTAQRPSPPVAGMLRFNTETELVEAYTGVEWSAGVDVEQAIADFAGGEPGQPRLVGQAIAAFPGTYPVLTVTASNAESVANGLVVIQNSGSSANTTFIDAVLLTVAKYSGTIRFRVNISVTFSADFEAQIIKNGNLVQTLNGQIASNTTITITADVSIVASDEILWRVRRTGGTGTVTLANGNNTASNGYIPATLFIPAV